MAENLQFYHGLADNFDEFKIRKYHKNDANMDYVIYLTDNLGWAIWYVEKYLYTVQIDPKIINNSQKLVATVFIEWE